MKTKYIVELMIYDSKENFGIISKIFHWVIAALAIGLLSAGYYMTSLPNSPQKFEIYAIHKETGILLLTLTLVRIIWRMRNTTPWHQENMPKWQQAASKINFYLLYILCLIMPSLGITMSLYSGRAINFFNLFVIPAFEKKAKLATLANELHKAFAVIFLISISLHIMASLYHHFIKKDSLLKRMM